jgi:hypothetical protein
MSSTGHGGVHLLRESHGGPHAKTHPKDHFATPHMAAFLKGLRPKTVTVKCYELGPEKKMPNAG